MVRRQILLLSRPLMKPAGPRMGRSYATTKQPSATTHFYKVFTRPVAKATLLAVLTYQIVYLTWTRLEAEEVRADNEGMRMAADSAATIARLEALVGAHAVAKITDAGKESKSSGR